MQGKIFILVAGILFLTSCTKVKTEYWPNGNKKSEITVSGNSYEGPAKYWYVNGNIQTSCFYKNNKQDGTLQSFYRVLSRTA